MEHFGVFKKNSLPFDQHTVIGYLFDMSLEIAFTFVYAYINGTFLVLFISICLHHRAFHIIVKESIQKWDENKNRNGEQFLRKLARFHASAKEYVQNKELFIFNLKLMIL